MIQPTFPPTPAQPPGVCPSLCQVSWSNVGKNFHGSKLLAVWPSGEASQTVFDAHNYRLFVPPLSPSEASALQSAARVALVRAGDLFIFSGGRAARWKMPAPGWRPLCICTGPCATRMPTHMPSCFPRASLV